MIEDVYFAGFDNNPLFTTGAISWQLSNVYFTAVYSSVKHVLFNFDDSVSKTKNKTAFYRLHRCAAFRPFVCSDIHLFVSVTPITSHPFITSVPFEILVYTFTS